MEEREMTEFLEPSENGNKTGRAASCEWEVRRGPFPGCRGIRLLTAHGWSRPGVHADRLWRIPGGRETP